MNCIYYDESGENPGCVIGPEQLEELLKKRREKNRDDDAI